MADRSFALSRAVGIWVMLVAVESIHGVMRRVFLEPPLGDLRARQVSVFTGAMEPAITETDWERFDGFTPTFTHPTLSGADLRLLLGSAYTQFYVRPSFLATYLRIGAPAARSLMAPLDGYVRRHHAREMARMGRARTC